MTIIEHQRSGNGTTHITDAFAFGSTSHITPKEHYNENSDIVTYITYIYEYDINSCLLIDAASNAARAYVTEEWFDT